MILDYVMPGMGGREVFEALKQIQPDVNVLLSSGYSSTDQVAALIERGCRGFIQKPYDTVKMSRTIRTILDTESVRYRRGKLRPAMRSVKVAIQDRAPRNWRVS